MNVMKKIIKKKMSIEDLALSMNKGFKRVENLIEKRIDGLAISTAKGFESVKNQLEGVSKRIDDFAENKVSKINFKELGHRVSFIEEKLAIKNK
jgi:hypothetical protein